MTTDSLSQPHELTGTIIDAGTRQPLKGANVYLVKSRRGTETEEDGRFHLVLESPIPGDTLVISFVGYA
ncbi:MAG: carboxypeptidase-like regulatory domain-containing protein, partial [Chloroflexi bacterium]